MANGTVGASMRRAARAQLGIGGDTAVDFDVGLNRNINNIGLKHQLQHTNVDDDVTTLTPTSASTSISTTISTRISSTTPTWTPILTSISTPVPALKSTLTPVSTSVSTATSTSTPRSASTQQHQHRHIYHSLNQYHSTGINPSRTAVPFWEKKLLGIRLVCPQNGTAVLKGQHRHQQQQQHRHQHQN